MKLVLADDAVLLREGLAGLLERAHHKVIAQTDNARDLPHIIDRLSSANNMPDVLITDVRMPPNMRDDGLKAAVKIRQKYPSLAIMILSQYVAPAYARTLFAESPQGIPAPSRDIGGIGYLLKDRISRVVDFLRSLQMVSTGGIVVDPQVASALMQQKSSSLDSLTPREREVLELMARGRSNTQIAEELILSAASISKHVANIFMKLGMMPDEENRRVRAVLEYLTATGT
ncbi:MAG: response regulator transcription factor [Actinomycetaceae bacterium]|nr:response regulator transcription factor [Actinomycetaceae bacterium]